MQQREYLVSFGRLGDFTRFRPADPTLVCRRGDRVVVRSQRGVELGSVLCPATSGHTSLLTSTYVGQLLRLASAEDEETAVRMSERGRRIFDDGRRRIVELRLPMEILDVEVLLDGQNATLHYLRWADCDERLLVGALAREHDVLFSIQNLALPTEPASDDHEGGCGKPDCGRKDGGSCTSCSSGGCATGCGSMSPGELTSYFAGLRQQMENRSRTSLL
jgi:hypothetical protein